jgi:hypothetical protein
VVIRTANDVLASFRAGEPRVWIATIRLRRDGQTVELRELSIPADIDDDE